MSRSVSQRPTGRRRGLSRGEDFALYVVISVGFLAALAWSAVYITADSNVVFKWWDLR